MPVVPIPQGPRLQADALRTVNATQADVSSGLAAFGQALGNVGEVAHRELQRQATAKAFEIDARVREEWDKLDAELRRKYRGERSAEYLAEAERWWEEAPGRVAGEVPPLARESLGRSLGAAKARALSGARAFHYGEQEKVLDQHFNASVTLETQGLLKDLSALNAVKHAETAEQSIDKKIEEYGKAKGMPKEAIEAVKVKYLGGYHADVVRRLMNSNLKDAKEYLVQFKARIDPDQYTALEKALKDTTDGAEVITAADAIIEQHGGFKHNKPIELDKLDAAARKLFGNDPAKLSALRSEIRVRVTAHQQTENARNGQHAAAAMRAVADGVSLARLRGMPEYQNLPGDTQAQIERALISRQEAAANRDEAFLRRREAQLHRTGMAAYYTYSRPEVLDRMTPGEIQLLAPSIGLRYTEMLLGEKNQREEAKARAASNPSKIPAPSIDQDVLNAAADRMGLEPFKPSKSEEDRARLGMFEFNVKQVIAGEQARLGRGLTTEEKQKIVDHQAAAVARVQRSILPDKNMPAAALRPEEAARVVVPPTAREAILRRLQQDYPGARLSEEEIRQVYLSRLLQPKQ